MFIGAVVQNHKLNRFHPIFFGLASPPSGDDDLAAQRYKSVSHHTEGFATLDEAVQEMHETCRIDGCGISTALFHWDGEGIPKSTAYFDRGNVTMPAGRP
jgi:hypothetical protein